MQTGHSASGLTERHNKSNSDSHTHAAGGRLCLNLFC